MADEFIKGLGTLMGVGLIWFTIAAWYNTPGFEDTQLIAPNPDDVGLYAEVLIAIKDVAFWFAILGTLTFWVVIPAAREGRRVYENRRNNAE